jgi:glyoxylase-like metal-dependent hydrolase (beta-lactamase superfamily II)
MRVADGVHQVDGIRLGSAYLVESDGGIVVVDSGVPGSAGHVLRALAALGRRPEDVRVVVLTHWHPDHAGGAAELRRRTGAQVAVHRLDGPPTAGGPLPPKGRRAMRLVRAVMRYEPVAADRLLEDGDEVLGLRVVHAPGHTAGSIALWRGDLVFSGDALLLDRAGRVGPSDAQLCLDPAQAATSADRILALRPRLVLSGHGRPFPAADGPRHAGGGRDPGEPANLPETED